jgi:hypothetical protein
MHLSHRICIAVFISKNDRTNVECNQLRIPSSVLKGKLNAPAAFVWRLVCRLIIASVISALLGDETSSKKLVSRNIRVDSERRLGEPVGTEGGQMDAWMRLQCEDPRLNWNLKQSIRRPLKTFNSYRFPIQLYDETAKNCDITRGDALSRFGDAVHAGSRSVALATDRAGKLIASAIGNVVSLRDSLTGKVAEAPITVRGDVVSLVLSRETGAIWRSRQVT